MGAPNSGKTLEQDSRRACDDCGEYNVHMTHEGVIYRFFHDERNFYHRHIVFCPDWTGPADPGMVN